jgi:glycosyltransferase involved in cell wall biosynthesis
VTEPVTVAIPVLNGGAKLREVLEALEAQRLDRGVEVLVADSGSTDGSSRLARRHGAEVIEVPPRQFSHGGTRNLLMRRASGSHVALLTQDALPADDRWLARLLEGFAVAPDVGLVFGPYRARPGASVMVRRELDGWFDSLPPEVRGLPDAEEPGATRRLFFTDANGCIARAAWEEVPFRDVAYAEDQLLARDMLAAGYAKVYLRDAAVVHSHDYGALDQLRRSFDEWRGLREVRAISSPPSVRDAALGVQRAVRDDLALARREGQTAFDGIRTAGASLRYHALRAIGATLGSRADRLPRRMTQACSLEHRAGFHALEEQHS